MAPKSVTFRRHDHLVSVLFGDLLSHSYNILDLIITLLKLCEYTCFASVVLAHVSYNNIIIASCLHGH